jgi:amidase
MIEEATIAELQSKMDAGEVTAREVAETYLERIEQIDRGGPAINAVIELNPDALDIAAALDVERAEEGPRGPLHGIPVLLKDNIDSADKMMTTAGSLALQGSIAPEDAFVTQRLREAGAVILGKANLSEWANFRSTRSTSGWSSRGGQTKNPYALDRNPCGSSSGSAVAVAANLCSVAVGTETDGSLICPAQTNSIVTIKPTLGLVSRFGVIPIAHSQDTAGPMARTVADAAILLGALTGVDGRDPATEASRDKSLTDYTPFLDPDGLRGARIGIARDFFGFDPRVDRIMEACIETMKRLGAEIVDPADIETARAFRDTEIEVLLYEFKADLNAYLARLGPDAPVHSLLEIIEFNEQHEEEVMPYFGQERMLLAQEKGPLTDEAYLEALKDNHRFARTEGIDATLQEHLLDAIVAPSGGPACLIDWIRGDHHSGGSSSPAAVAGYPNITVPAGYVYGLPVGISFFGGAYHEPTLIRLAYAFEQATRIRRAPRFLPSADLGGQAIIAPDGREV